MLGVWSGALCWQQHFRLFSDGPQLKVPSVADAMQWTVNTDVAFCCLVGFSHACAECTFRHIVSRCGHQTVKQTITWVLMTGLKLSNRPLPGFRWRASGCETDHYLGSGDGPQAVKHPWPGFRWRASGCETDHYLGSGDGPQAVKHPWPGFRWRASGCETDHYCYLGSGHGSQAVKQTIIVTWVPMTVFALVRPVYLTAWVIRRQNESETFTSVLGRLNRNINNDNTNETVFKSRKTSTLK